MMKATLKTRERMLMRDSQSVKTRGDTSYVREKETQSSSLQRTRKLTYALRPVLFRLIHLVLLSILYSSQ